VVRRAFIAGTLALVATPLAAEAQEAGQVYRIGFLSPRRSTGMTLSVEAFRQGLRDLGYIEGKSVVIEYPVCERRLERLPSLAAELVRLNVEIIVAAETPAIRPAREATKTIPIIFPVAGDPVATGDVQSLARPGANVTGLSILAPDLGGKRLELLKEMMPGLSRLAVLWVPENPYAALVLRETEGQGSTGASSASIEGARTCPVREGILWYGPGPRRRSHADAGLHVLREPNAACCPRSQEPTAGRFSLEGIRRSGRPVGLWAEHS